MTKKIRKDHVTRSGTFKLGDRVEPGDHTRPFRCALIPLKKEPKATRSIRFDVADLKDADDFGLDVSEVCRQALAAAIDERRRSLNGRKRK